MKSSLNMLRTITLKQIMTITIQHLESLYTGIHRKLHFLRGLYPWSVKPLLFRPPVQIGGKAVVENMLILAFIRGLDKTANIFLETKYWFSDFFSCIGISSVHTEYKRIEVDMSYTVLYCFTKYQERLGRNIFTSEHLDVPTLLQIYR